MELATPVYVPLLSKYPNKENGLPFTTPETNITFATADPENVKVPLSVPLKLVWTTKVLLALSLRVAVTSSGPNAKFNVPEKVPASRGTTEPVNVPESEQFAFEPEYVPVTLVPLRV